MRKIVRVIDAANEWVGLATRWLIILAVLITVTEVVQRYVFGWPTMWGPELAVMAAAAMYALAWGYIHRHGGHVRVDVFYSRLSPRVRAILDVVCALLFFLPVIGLLVYASGSWMWRAWEVGERSRMTFWHPPIAPLRTAIFVGLCLLMLQGIARFIRDLHFLVRNRPL